MDFCSEQSWLASAKRLTCRSPAVKTCPEWRREMAWGCWIRPLKSHSPRMHFLPVPFVSPCTLCWSVAKTNPNIRLVFVESLLASHVFLVFGCNLLWSQVVVRASSTESQAMPRFTPLAWFGKPCSQDQTFAILLLQDNRPSKLSLKSVMIYIAASQAKRSTTTTVSTITRWFQRSLLFAPIRGRFPFWLIFLKSVQYWKNVCHQGLPDLPDDANAPCSVSPSYNFQAGEPQKGGPRFYNPWIAMDCQDLCFEEVKILRFAWICHRLS